ncbi:M67 family peptidase [bacterium]|nr:M67 family peptidase [bacterium]
MLRINSKVYEDIVTHAQQGFPIEVCGILGGSGDIVTESHQVRNLKASPEHFLMDPREQITAMKSLDARGLELLAFYHSHPLGPASPSAEDIRLAFYPDVITVIISMANPDWPVLRAFRIREMAALEMDLVIIP